MIKNFILKVRRRETPVHDGIFRLAKRIQQFEVPVFYPLFKTLYVARELLIMFWGNFIRIFYHTPVFKTRCQSVGQKLYLIGGIPQVIGHLEVRVGDNVTINGHSTFVGAKVVDQPILDIGDDSYLGWQIGISVAEKVVIGKHVLIANQVVIIGYDSHPLDPLERSLGEPCQISEGGGSILIGDYSWIGSRAMIMKGVSIGEGAVVCAASVVTSDVAPYTVVAGNPAKAIKSLSGGEQHRAG